MTTTTQTNETNNATAGHTPGPWINTFSGFLNGAQYVTGLTDNTGHEWARVVQSPLGKGGNELDANARLIAAAPELLEALTESADVIGTAYKELDFVLTYWDTFTGGHAELKARLSALKYILDDSRARAVLAKATT